MYRGTNEFHFSPEHTCVNVSDIIVKKGKTWYTLLLPVNYSNSLWAQLYANTNRGYPLSLSIYLMYCALRFKWKRNIYP